MAYDGYDYMVGTPPVSPPHHGTPGRYQVVYDTCVQVYDSDIAQPCYAIVCDGELSERHDHPDSHIDYRGESDDSVEWLD